MAKKLLVTEPRQVQIVDVPDNPLSPGQVRVRAHYLGISIGTEMNTYRGGVNWHTGRDPATRLFKPDAAEQKWEYPATIGYAHVGEIIEVANDVDSLSVGQLVHSTAGHVTPAVMPVERANPIPEGQDPRRYVFLQLVRTALGIVHHANPTLGDTAAVYGLGVVGLLVVQLLRRAGVKHIIGFDLIELRRDMAGRFGADVVLDPTAGDPATAVRAHNNNEPVDIAIEAAANDKALQAAVRSVCRRGRVVIGSMPNHPWQFHFGQEMHFNGVRIYGANVTAFPDDLGPGWSAPRRDEYAIELLSDLDLLPLLTHEFPLDEAPRVYEMLDQNPNDVISVALKC